MNKTQKINVVEEISETLSTAPYVALADYRGVTVEEINALRRNIEKQGMTYRVVKNTLALKAIEGTDKAVLGKFLTGMTGWIISGDDPIAAAKTLRETTKDLRKAEKFVIKGGYFEGVAMDAEGIQNVADLPSREELLVMLLRTVQESGRQVLGVLQAPGRDLVYLLSNRAKDLEEGEGQA